MHVILKKLYSTCYFEKRTQDRTKRFLQEAQIFSGERRLLWWNELIVLSYLYLFHAVLEMVAKGVSVINHQITKALLTLKLISKLARGPCRTIFRCSRKRRNVAESNITLILFVVWRNHFNVLCAIRNKMEIDIAIMILLIPQYQWLCGLWSPVVKQKKLSILLYNRMILKKKLWARNEAFAQKVKDWIRR